MKTLLILITLTINLYAQEVEFNQLKLKEGIHYLDDNAFTGTAIKKHPKTELIYDKIPIIKGKIHGIKERYHKTVVLLSTVQYKDGVADGLSISYRGRRVELITPYQNGKINGEQLYYHKDGTLSHTFTYKDGIQHGISRSYYKSGSLESTVIYKNGKRDGEYIEYNKLGEVIIKASSLEGHLIKGYKVIDGKKVYFDYSREDYDPFKSKPKK